VNWDDMRLFLAVARSGSLSGGAKLLDLQHSTVSRRMRKLEEDLGVRLFDKVRNGYELTAAGESLKIAATRMESEVLNVDGTLSDKDLQLGGALRVTAVDSMATSLLMPMFASFSRRYPKVTVHIIVSNSDVSLAQREADVAIRLANTPPDTLIGKRVTTVSSAILGDADPVLERWCDPRPEWELGMWILLHPDLKRTARVLAFRDHMMEAIEAQSDLFGGRRG